GTPSPGHRPGRRFLVRGGRDGRSVQCRSRPAFVPAGAAGAHPLPGRVGQPVGRASLPAASLQRPLSLLLPPRLEGCDSRRHDAGAVSAATGGGAVAAAAAAAGGAGAGEAVSERPLVGDGLQPGGGPCGGPYAGAAVAGGAAAAAASRPAGGAAGGEGAGGAGRAGAGRDL